MTETLKESMTPEAAALLDAHGLIAVQVQFRSRVNRAIRWPLTFGRFVRAGCSLGTAWRLTHWTCWYDLETKR